MTVGTIRFVSVNVESCFGSHPICSTRLPSFDSAAERLDDVVDFPIPPLPYTARTSVPSIFSLGSRCTCRLPSPSSRDGSTGRRREVVIGGGVGRRESGEGRRCRQAGEGGAREQCAARPHSRLPSPHSRRPFIRRLPRVGLPARPLRRAGRRASR